MKISKNVITANFVVLFATIVVMTRCNSGAASDQNMVMAEDNQPPSELKISNMVLGEIIKSIPSPLEISMMIKESGSNYDSRLLNNTDHHSNYTSRFKKAVNLGIYGADLGYINIYNKNLDAISYLTVIKRMADEMNIGQFYDFATLRRLASNSENADSLLYITTSNFEKINDYLHEQKRSDQSVLILTGGWLEALHISCKIAEKDNNQALVEKIGEQKIVLEQVILLLSNFTDQDNVRFLHAYLQKLKAVYDKITITYTYQESTMKEVDGVLMVVNESTSKVNITPEQLKEITSIVEEIRTKITE